MAIRPSEQYPGQTDAGDLAGYPYGKAQNQSIVGDGTGTPLEAAWVNDVWGFLQALLQQAGVTPSGFPDKVGASDYLLALATMIAGPTNALLARVAELEAAFIEENTYTSTIPLRVLPVISRDGQWRIHRGRDFVEGGREADVFLIDLSPFVRRGATLTKVEADISTVARTGDERFSIALCSQSYDMLPLSQYPLTRTFQHTPVYAAENVGGEQQVVLEPNLAVSARYYLEIKASTNLTPAGDTLHGVRLTHRQIGL